eukprot:1824-Pelagococcus_subviridis.AAC.1
MARRKSGVLRGHVGPISRNVGADTPTRASHRTTAHTLDMASEMQKGTFAVKVGLAQVRIARRSRRVARGRGVSDAAARRAEKSRGRGCRVQLAIAFSSRDASGSLRGPARRVRRRVSPRPRSNSPWRRERESVARSRARTSRERPRAEIRRRRADALFPSRDVIVDERSLARSIAVARSVGQSFVRTSPRRCRPRATREP